MRSERMFKTLRGQLPAEFSELGIVEMEEANRFLRDKLVGDFNRDFMVAPREEGSGFVPLFDVKLDDILCLKHRKVVGNDNCASYKGMSLEIPPVEGPLPLCESKGDGARVLRREHGDIPREVQIGSYDNEGRLKNEGETSRARARVGRHRSFTSSSRSVA